MLGCVALKVVLTLGNVAPYVVFDTDKLGLWDLDMDCLGLLGHSQGINFVGKLESLYLYCFLLLNSSSHFHCLPDPH